MVAPSSHVRGSYVQTQEEVRVPAPPRSVVAASPLSGAIEEIGKMATVGVVTWKASQLVARKLCPSEGNGKNICEGAVWLTFLVAAKIIADKTI